jgi:predicted house-cleaning noncanonical NTP pyrophosphatase (MazG superfamily)
MADSKDRLDDMFLQQEQFMRLLQEKRTFPDFPVDLSTKSGQKLVKEVSYECADELHEARQLLKNSKSHRATEITEFDRDDYVEELSDALHYFFEVVILSGVTQQELFESFMKKGEKNVNRIKNGY